MGHEMAATPEPPEKMRFQLTLRRRGISDLAVLRAMEEVPREIFVETRDRADAYRDSALAIACGQTISQPFVVAYMTEQLQLRKEHKVLEIGTGSGYQAAVLAEIGASVFSIERHQPLSKKAEEILEHLGYHNVQTFYGDGFKGLPTFAPFDKILITAAAPEIPKELLKQLKINGMMVIPFGEGEVQQMIRITRLDKNEFEKETFSNFTFVPMLKGIEG